MHESPKTRLYHCCLACEDTCAASLTEQEHTECSCSDWASLVRLGVASSQQKEMFPALAGCRFNYCWSSLPEGLRCPIPRPFSRGSAEAGVPGVVALVTSHLQSHPSSWPMACQMQSKQALNFLENFLHFNMRFSCGKSTRRRGNPRQNLQLPLITHAAKFIRSQCPLNSSMEFSMHSPVSLLRGRPSHWVLCVSLLSDHPCLGHFG